MICLQSWSVFTIVVLLCSCVTSFGLSVKSGNSNHHSNLKTMLNSKATPSLLTLLKNFSSSWTHRGSGRSFNNHPTKRQMQSPDVDESFLDSLTEPKDVFDVNGKDEAPFSRQVIFEPRQPRPYPFEPLHVHLASPFETLRYIPRPLHVHHYRGVPVAVRVPKYEHVPEPYYVPYKPRPDYTVLHVHVDDPANPCMNGGLPLASQFGYHCLCSRDYHGRFCDAKLYCSSSPCQNGGVCEEIENNYQCQCKSGYLGYNCEEKNACRPNPCRNDGQCVETSNSYRCYCRPGFISKSCEDLDYCDPNPCQHGGTCQQRHGFHECICNEEYKGKLCEQKRVCFTNPCKNGGECVEDDPRFPCICPKGYSPPHCKVHVCDSNPCLNGGKCVPRKAGNYWTYHCMCSLLYKGEKCELPNPCVTNPCLHGGTCIDSYSRYKGFPKDWDVGYLHYYCACPPEYSGQKCEENLCLKCDSNASCDHGRCICEDGFRGDGFKCTVIEDPCSPNPCQNNGTCTKGPDESFDCECPKGYFPPICSNPKDACMPNPCKNHGICVNDGNDAFHCMCPADFLPPDCANKTIDPCTSNPCQNRAMCQPSEDKRSFTCKCIGSFKPPLCTCDCPKGDLQRNPPIFPQHCHDETGECYCRGPINGIEYSETPRGCEEARGNPCASNPCQNGGKCFPSKDMVSFDCQCPEQCSGDLCQKCDEVKICTPGYCKNGGTCLVVGMKPFCKCPQGFVPPTCANKSITGFHSQCHPNPCQNGGLCRNVGSIEHECHCFARFSGKNCERDKCMDCDVYASCFRGLCRCRPGYRGSGLKGDCKQVSGCQTCPLNAVCVDGECSCIKGFYFINNTCKIIDGN